MAYQTIADLTKQFQEHTLIVLSDDEQSGARNDARLQEALDSAAGTIDGWLGGRFEVPLESVPGIIARISGEITLYELYGRRPDIETPQGVSDRYRGAIKLLEAISAGKVVLAGIDPSGTTEAGSGILSNAKPPLLTNRLNQY